VPSYERDFIPGGFRNNGNGVDKSKITKLMVDESRLVAITFSGANSRILDLEPYRQGLVGVNDYFERLPSATQERRP
jgi:hypothetical protein